MPSVVKLSSQQRNELKSVETEIKYAGYLTQQQRSIDRLKKAEQRSIPDWFDYRAVSGLSREMQEKLLKIRPRTLGHPRCGLARECLYRAAGPSPRTSLRPLTSESCGRTRAHSYR